MTTIAAAHIDVTDDTELEYFFQAHHFLALYGRENEWAATFGNSVRSARDRVWYYMDRIAALKAEKIVWPDAWVNGGNCPQLPIAVDASHFVT
jgi:hypothetical protein